MLCPVCRTEMTEEDFGGVLIDVCKDGCGGLWFDCRELRQLDCGDEGFGKALQEALHAPCQSDKRRGRIDCPKCGMPMQLHLHRTSRELMVDECYVCGGIFLDVGELKTIRDGYREGDTGELTDEIGELSGSELRELIDSELKRLDELKVS